MKTVKLSTYLLTVTALVGVIAVQLHTAEGMREYNVREYLSLQDKWTAAEGRQGAANYRLQQAERALACERIKREGGSIAAFEFNCD